MKDRRDKIAKVQMRSDDGKENKDDVLKEAWDLTRVIYYQVNLSLSLSVFLQEYIQKTAVFSYYFMN